MVTIRKQGCTYSVLVGDVAHTEGVTLDDAKRIKRELTATCDLEPKQGMEE